VLWQNFISCVTAKPQQAGAWGMEKDPGLDDRGRAQARATALTLAPLGPLPIITSPLARTREISKPLIEIWQIEARVEPRAGEIRFPSETPADRVHWLKERFQVSGFGCQADEVNERISF
jgi:broad specificity phosphatase PhoE